jgi:tyrosinase
MQTFLSPSIGNPAGGEQAEFSRADLIFYGVDHSGPSFEARIFFNNPGATADTPREDASGYAGSFTVFGHAGCAGDAGHCHVPTAAKDPFDRRPPHALTPHTKTVIVTDALQKIGEPTLTITVVPVRPGPEGAEVVDTLTFERFSLLLYA